MALLNLAFKFIPLLENEYSQKKLWSKLWVKCFDAITKYGFPSIVGFCKPIHQIPQFVFITFMYIRCMACVF